MRILKKQIPLKYLYLIGVMVIVLVSIGLYQTYAMFTANVDSGNALNLVADVTYEFGINGTQNFSVSPRSSIAFNALVSNDTLNSIYYEVYYSSNDNLSDVIIAELVSVIDDVSITLNTSGTLASGDNKTIPVGLINNGDSSVNITVGVVNTSIGNSITYGTNNYPSGSKITAVYDANEIINGCGGNLGCITKTVNGVEKVYCRKSDYGDLVISSNIGTFSHGLYNVTTNCDNADSTFLTKTREFAISNLTNYSYCEATYTALSPSNYTTLYQRIINDWNNGSNTKNIYKETHTLSSGSTYSEYRYEGTDTAVENYVWFNNELWRIIGAFPGGTPSTMSGTTFVQGNGAPSVNNTVKIIRNEAIGSFAWDKDNTNNWTTAELNTNILNNLYLNSGSGTCNFYSTSVAKACSFSENGLLSVQDYIEDATWNLGGWNSTSVKTVDMYNYERGTTTRSNYPLLTTAKVGLMYPSDYGYATASDSCQTGTNLVSYGSCGKDGWILKYGDEWTQSLDSGYTTDVSYVNYPASMNYNYAYSGFSARPVVYLKSNIYVTGGDGSINNPYQIAIG